MPINIIKREQMPMLRGRHESPIKSIPEWVEVKEILACGLKPFEVAEVTLRFDPTICRLKRPLELFALNLKKHCKRLHLDYEVRTTADDAEKFSGKIYVVGR